MAPQHSLQQHTQPNRIRGFTMVELVVVLGIILALAGLGFPVMRSVLEASKRDATKAMVEAVATTIVDRGTTGEFKAAGKLIRLPLWDLNHDGFLDGTSGVIGAGGDAITLANINDYLLPGDRYVDIPLNQAAIRAGLEELGYSGFLETTGFTAKRKQIDGATGRLLDPWKRPLRYAFAPARKNVNGIRSVVMDYINLLPNGAIKTMATSDASLYGTHGFAVWSAGKDGIDDTADDIASYQFPP